MQVQSLRQIRRRIKSIESTQKLTKAMEMISISKLRSIQNQLDNFRLYFGQVEELFFDVFTPGAGSAPFLKTPPGAKKILLCVVTADTGLCGVYNQAILRRVKSFLDSHPAARVEAYCVGRRALGFITRAGVKVIGSRLSVNGRYSTELADGIAQALMERCVSGDYKEAHVAYTIFNSGARHIPTIEKFLPVDPPQHRRASRIFEPDQDALLAKAVPLYLYAKMRSIFLNAFACEHSARGIAMGEATDNAKQILETLILMRNKVRQAHITREIIEVISSSEALKG